MVSFHSSDYHQKGKQFQASWRKIPFFHPRLVCSTFTSIRHAIASVPSPFDSCPLLIATDKSALSADGLRTYPIWGSRTRYAAFGSHIGLRYAKTFYNKIIINCFHALHEFLSLVIPFYFALNNRWYICKTELRTLFFFFFTCYISPIFVFYFTCQIFLFSIISFYKIQIFNYFKSSNMQT